MRFLSRRRSRAAVSVAVSVACALGLAAAPPGSTAATSAPAAGENVRARVLPYGQDLTIRMLDGSTANVMLPSNDADGETTIGVRPVPPPSGAGVIADFEISVDRTTTFWTPPTLYYTFATQTPPGPPMLAEIDDGDRVVATIDQFHFGPASFVGQQWTEPGGDLRLTLLRGRVYHARVVASPPSMVAFDASLAPAKIDLPDAGGTGLTLATPPMIAGGAHLAWRTATEPPLGIPAYDRPGTAVLAYATMLLVGNATFAGEAGLTLRLPQAVVASGSDARLGLVEYTMARWHAGWRPIPVAFSRQPGAPGVYAARLAVPETRVPYGRYAFAVVRSVAPEPSAAGEWTPGAQPARPDARADSAAPAIAVLGDSTSLMTVLPPSALRCPVQFGPLPTCQFTPDPALNYPGIVGRLTGARVLNLSWPTTEAGPDWTYGESERTLQVPEIPAGTRVVIFGGGILDAFFDFHENLVPRLEAMDAAIRARVPHAHIVYVSLRYWLDTATDPARRAAIDAWDEREEALAAQHGDAFIDYRTLIPAGYSAATPDGEHLSIEGSRLVAETIADALGRWHLFR